MGPGKVAPNLPTPPHPVLLDGGVVSDTGQEWGRDSKMLLLVDSLVCWFVCVTVGKYMPQHVCGG